MREHVRGNPNARVALVGPTAADCRDTMIEGESGLMGVFPPSEEPKFEASKRRVTFANGAIATYFSADAPERLRGPQHTAAWCDELCAWRYQREAWDQLQFGLRLGDNPRACITTTPKPTAHLKELLVDPLTHVTKGTTYDNLQNLARNFRRAVVGKYEGTRLGRQELNAEVLEDVQGALWARSELDKRRINYMPEMRRIVVAIDPPTTSGASADECGIVVAGIDENGRGYVIDDKSVAGLTPKEWAAKAIDAYYQYNADRIIAEVNNGGELVEAVVRQVDETVSYKAVTASRGKVARAEPISALYEQGKVSHIGTFSTLEDQMCAFTIDFDAKAMGYSPDRVDALVWALTELMTKKKAKRQARAV